MKRENRFLSPVVVNDEQTESRPYNEGAENRPLSPVVFGGIIGYNTFNGKPHITGNRYFVDPLGFTYGKIIRMGKER